eukprot:Sdes_comp16564_c0_seq2m5875
MAETCFGKTHPVYASSLCDLGLSLKHQGDYQGACTNYGEALDIYKQACESMPPPKYYPPKITTMVNLMVCLAEMNEIQDSLKMAADLVDVVGEANGSDSFAYGKILYQIAGIMEKISGRSEEAENIYLEALRILHSTGGEKIETAICMSNLAAFYVRERILKPGQCETPSEWSDADDLGRKYAQEVHRLCEKASAILEINHLQDSHPLSTKLKHIMNHSVSQESRSS